MHGTVKDLKSRYAQLTWACLLGDGRCLNGDKKMIHADAVPWPTIKEVILISIIVDNKVNFVCAISILDLLARKDAFHGYDSSYLARLKLGRLSLAFRDIIVITWVQCQRGNTAHWRCHNRRRHFFSDWGLQFYCPWDKTWFAFVVRTKHHDHSASAWSTKAAHGRLYLPKLERCPSQDLSNVKDMVILLINHDQSKSFFWIGWLRISGWRISSPVPVLVVSLLAMSPVSCWFKIALITAWYDCTVLSRIDTFII